MDRIAAQPPTLRVGATGREAREGALILSRNAECGGGNPSRAGTERVNGSRIEKAHLAVDSSTRGRVSGEGRDWQVHRDLTRANRENDKIS